MPYLVNILVPGIKSSTCVRDNFRYERDVDGSYFAGTFENAGWDVEATAFA